MDERFEVVADEIEVLGSGCRACESLAAAAGQAATQLGIEHELVKVKDIAAFASYGLMMTPGLVVDGVLRSQGKVPSVEEIKALLGDEAGGAS